MLTSDTEQQIQQFYPGEAGGISIAEAIVGLYNPSGKMSISAPRHVGTLPVNYKCVSAFQLSPVSCSALEGSLTLRQIVTSRVPATMTLDRSTTTELSSLATNTCSARPCR